MSNKLLYLVDTLDYVRNNCFQRQLFSAMEYGYEIQPLEIFPSAFFPLRKLSIRLDRYDKIISVLRLRTLHAMWPVLKPWLSNVPITIYDQDPWESYIDGSPTKGIYKILHRELNIDRVYVTAPWWANHLRSDGIPASFVRMGIEPRFCDPGLDFDARPVMVGFRGAMHEHRKIVFKQLQSFGIDLEVGQGRLDYPGYMNYLQSLKFFAHDESALPWICDGVPISRSTGCWVKSVETVSRGTFCLRDFHEEGEAYNLSKLPLIQCYESPGEAPDLINRVMALPNSVKRDMQVQTVEQIRTQYDWLNTAHKMVTGT
jgi:hypothetical protein